MTESQTPAGVPTPAGHDRGAPASEGPGAPRQWTVELPWLALLNANGRRHWRYRATATRRLREAATWLTIKADVPRLQRAHVLCELRFPDRRRRDPANWSPSAKAAVDGLVDAGVLPDDSARYLDGPDMRLGEPEPSGYTSGFGRLVLHITEVSP